MPLQEIRRSRDSVSRLLVRLLLPFNDGSNGLGAAELKQTREACQGAAERLNCDLLEVNAEADHLGLLIEHPPERPVSRISHAMKRAVDRMLRQEFPLQPYGDYLWGSSYFATSADGAPIETLRQSIGEPASP